MNTNPVFPKGFASLQLFQSGAALVVSLIFLLVMTILALSMSQTTTLEERMAGNARNANLAFQGAEAAVKSGQTFVTSNLPTLNTSGVDVTQQNDSWWSTNGTQFGSGAQDLPTLSSDPYYIVRPRALHVTHGSLATPPAERPTSYYEVVGRSHGNNTDSEAVTSEVVAIPD